MTYDPVTYWTERGRTFEAEAQAKGWHDSLDIPLSAVLAELHTPATVLDVGCGYGRLAMQVRHLWPSASYTGLDVSADLVAATQARVPDAEGICADLVAWEADRTWDLVLAVSVLGHLLPADVPNVVDKLRDFATRDLIIMDWDETGGRTGYQYGHDYRALLPDAERTLVTPAMAIYHVRRP